MIFGLSEQTSVLTDMEISDLSVLSSKLPT
jgi:hypothetical protein